MTYAYNPSGLRNVKTVGGSTKYFVYNGMNIVYEYSESVADGVAYFYGLNRTHNSNGEIYVYNAHGDVVQLVRENAVVASYTYDAFGNLTSTIGTSDNPFLYCGEYFDTETQTYYLRARYYNPANGRFNAEDTHWNATNCIYGDNLIKLNEREDALGLNQYTLLVDVTAVQQSGNLYVYCGSNPLMWVDPTGDAWYHWLAGAAIVGVAAALTVVTAGGALPAIMAVTQVAGSILAGSMITVGSTAAIAAGAFIGSSLVLGTAALVAARNSNSIGEFLDQGSWGTVAYTAGGALAGAVIGSVIKELQSCGEISGKVKIDKLLNNPKDEFTTIGPKPGRIREWIEIIQKTGDYGDIYVQDLGNGYYMLADGHHRVAALASLGKNVISVYITK